ncbi:hypothetical protein PGB90_009637 [Kerria lacca]
MGWKKVDVEDKLNLLENESLKGYGTLVDISDKKSKKDEQESKPSFLHLFKYATKLDITLMIIGTLFSIFGGACLPILGYFFGGMTNLFVKQSTQGLISDNEMQNVIDDAYTNATPVNMVYTEYNTPIKFKNGTILFKVVYVLKELFSGNMTYSDVFDNNTFSSPPLSESEFNNSLDVYFIIYLIIGTLLFLSSFIQTICWELSSEHQVHTLRKLYFAEIIRQDISWYDQNNDGNLPNKLSDDLERIRDGTGHKFVMIVQYAATFISGIIVGLSVNIELTLITLCTGPFLIGLNAYLSSFTATQVSREQQKYAKAGAIAEEALTNVKTVNAYSGQFIEIKKYWIALEDGRKIAMKRYNVLSVCMCFTFFFTYGSYALSFWYGSKMIEEGKASPGSVFTVFFSVLVGAFSLGNALPFLNIVSAAVGVNASINEILNKKITIDPYSTTGRKLYQMNGNIEFKDVIFSYPSRPTIQILNGLSLNVAPGKTAAIVGSSGAGKSTIISLILRFYDPNSGQVCIDDIPVSEFNVNWLRNQIGLVSQEPVLFGVSIKENISYGRENVTEYEVEEAAKQANAHDFITKLPAGYDTLVGDTGSQLSGGQKQRIAIARALVRNPKILLLDEATSALDANSESIVQETLTNVMKGRTTVIVAHRLSTIKNSDIIYVMQNGQLFERGTHDELMKKHSLYYKLVLAQIASEEKSGVLSELSSSEMESEDELTVSVQPTETTILETDEDVEDQEKNTKSLTRDAKIIDEISDNETSYAQEKKINETPWKVLDRQISSETLSNESDDEYETIVTHIRETREIIFDETENNQKYDETKTIETNEPPLNKTTERKKKRKNEHDTTDKSKIIPLSQAEPIEKSISFIEFIKLQTPECPWLLIGIIGCIGAGSVPPIFALFYGEIFRVFTLTGDVQRQASIFWTYMFIALSVYCGLSHLLNAKGMTEANEKLLVRVRAQVFENILRQPVGWFDLETSSPGILVNRLARNIPLIKAAAGVRISQVLSSLVTLLGAFFIAFICGWQLSLVLFICVPIVIYASFKRAALLKKNEMRDALIMDDAGKVASETVRNIRTVQALGQQKLFQDIYSGHLELPYKESKWQAFLYSFLYSLTQGVSFYMYAIAFRYGGYLVEIGEMTSENIYKVFFALSLCATTVGQSFMYLQDWNKARHAVRILNYLLTRKSEIDSSSPNGVQPNLKGNVEFKNVRFIYPTRPNMKVLRGINFKIESGKTLALVGESGCGKSTVISLLERFYDPISGIILIDDYDIRTLNISYLRSNIGIVNQEPILFDCSIKDNIAYGAVALEEKVSFDRIVEAAKIANVHDFIMSLPKRYDTMVGERGVQLSGGQKQRVAIARALIRNPKILLLDEATSALDTENEKIVQAALDNAKKGRTCIVVAHRLSTIQNADKICVVNAGKIVESGTHEELLQLKGQYYELTQRQFL